MAAADDDFVVDFPTLGFLVADWVEAHCTLPGPIRAGDPFVMYRMQLKWTVKHYQVRPAAQVGQFATAFEYRRSQIVAPQKTGKGPWGATITLNEAAGPAVFDGWAGKDDGYACSDHGCGCGWEYSYDRGDPMGRPWTTPLIQLLATSEDQVKNVYRPLSIMVKAGPLGDIMRVGEEFVRVRDDGLIEKVTSSAQSRLGNPITFALQDEPGLYTKENKLLEVAQTMRRGLAGMGGRAIGTTNAWDPSENSDAQRTMESKRPDIFKYHRTPPAGLSYRNKEDRRRIHRYVYEDAEHIDLDGIEAEAAELIETDPPQAERFYGNRGVQGAGTWLPDGLWKRQESPEEVPKGTRLALGFDGSDNDDWTAIRLSTGHGYRFTPTYGPDRRPTIWNPAEWGGEIPRAEVSAAVDEICSTYKIVLAYCDPRDWQSEIGAWALKYGEDVFVEWATYRITQMHEALNRAVTDLKTGRTTHDACEDAERHVGNARKFARPGDRYILGKPNNHQKIDVAMADVLASEAAAVAHEGKKFKVPKRGIVVY